MKTLIKNGRIATAFEGMDKKIRLSKIKPEETK
jgi:hypothetical protein